MSFSTSPFSNIIMRINENCPGNCNSEINLNKPEEYYSIFTVQGAHVKAIKIIWFILNI